MQDSQPPPMQQQQQIQIQYVNQPVFVQSTYIERYNAKQSLITGIVQIVMGVLCIIFNAAGIDIGDILGNVGYGIWGGIMFILAGVFGIVAAKTKSRCMVITYMVLCIKSAVVALIIFIIAAASAGLDTLIYTCIPTPALPDGVTQDYQNYNNYDYNNYEDCTTYNSQIAMAAMVAVYAVVAAVFAIWGSVICCRATCCGAKIPVYPPVVGWQAGPQNTYNQPGQPQFYPQGYPQPYYGQPYPGTVFPQQMYDEGQFTSTGVLNNAATGDSTTTTPKSDLALYNNSATETKEKDMFGLPTKWTPA